MPKALRRPILRTVTPAFTVSVMAYVMREDGRVLLLRHSYMPGWGLPGGVIDRGEDLVHAIVRETWEEVGLVVEVTERPTYSFDPHDRIVRFIANARLVEGGDADSAHASSSEIVEVRWFEPEDLPTLIDASRIALDALRETPAESR
jgi:8-oxo-dGTP pyrophosphatase MutT (NUDIX family)